MIKEKTKQELDEEIRFAEHLARKNKHGKAKTSKSKKKMIKKSRKINRGK
jgi:hypothetical protein